MRKTKVVFRADGNSEIGLGHVVRSLALAEMLKEDFECVFASQEPSHALLDQIKNVCPDYKVLPTCSLEHENLVNELDSFLRGDEIVVLDGYKFTTNYQSHIKSKGCSLVCIDDIHTDHFVADAVINPSGGLSEKDYSKESYTQLFLGPQYSLLRGPFLKISIEKRSDTIDHLFINLGGADPQNETCKILTQVYRVDIFKTIHVVTGSAFKYLDEVQHLIVESKRITHYHNLSAQEIVRVMNGCGIAICAPSSVAFEYCHTGGIIFLKQIADNQSDLKSYFVEQKVAFDFDVDFEKVLKGNLEFEFNKIIKTQKRFFDGKSGVRIKEIFTRISFNHFVSIRNARMDDLMTCYEWANEVEVRNQSFNSGVISLTTHTEWFQQKLRSSHCNYYIIEYHGQPVGQIRFEGEKQKVLSYLIAADMRNKGLGSFVLQKGISQLVTERNDVEIISGYVKKTNIASCKAFEKAGFNCYDASENGVANSYRYEFKIDKPNALSK